MPRRPAPQPILSLGLSVLFVAFHPRRLIKSLQAECHSAIISIGRVSYQTRLTVLPGIVWCGEDYGPSFSPLEKREGWGGLR